MTELERLGRVDPPAPAVLDAAREVLWSAVAAEMLATAPSQATRPAVGEPAARRAADDIASQPRPEDPGVR